MSLEDDIAAGLAALPDLAAVKLPVFWSLVPQKTQGSYIVLYRAGGLEGAAHDGPDGLGSLRLQVNAYGPTAALAQKYRKTVVDALNGKTPLFGCTQILSAIHNLSLDKTDSEAFVSDVRFCALADLNLQYQVSS